MSLGITAKTIALVAVLLGVTVPAVADSSLGSSPGTPPRPIPADTLLPNVGILSFKLGSRAPASEPIRRIGTGMYRSVDHGVHLLVWRNPSGIVDHVEAQRADSLRLDGRPLSAGYSAFRTMLTPEEGWKSFGCGGGIRGLMLTGRSQSLTFVRWNQRTALASISLRSQEPVLGVCGDLSGPPPPLN